MSKLLFVFFVGISSAFCQKNTIEPNYKKMLDGFYEKNIPIINTQDAEKLLGNKQVYFLDTREKKEFNVSHIQNAKLVGYDKIDWSTIKAIPKDAHVIVYCSVGYRSQEITKKMLEMGFSNVQNLYGGLFLWVNQERIIVNSKNQKTTKIHGFDKDWSKWIQNGEIVL